MTGISYRTTIDDADMRAKLDALIARMADAEPFYANVGEHLITISIPSRFENEEAPDGSKWQGLSDVTKMRDETSEYSRSGILWVSGALKQSFNRQADSTSVRVGSDLPYAAIQHFGGETKGYMKDAVIPARPILGLSADDETEIFAIAEDWLAVE